VPNSLDRCVPSRFGTDPTINLTMNTMSDAVADPVVAPFGQTHTNYSFTMIIELSCDSLTGAK
jgi:hypothetical protein